MSKVCGSRYKLFLLLVSACLSVLGPANAQMSKQEKERISSSMAAEINLLIKSHPKGGILLRENVIGRLVQCGELFIFMSKHAGDPETSRRISDVADISLDVSERISDGVATARFEAISNAAKQSMKDRFATDPTQESERELRNLLTNCKSFHRPNELSAAVGALLSSTP